MLLASLSKCCQPFTDGLSINWMGRVVVGGGPCPRSETPYVGMRTDDVFVQDKKAHLTVSCLTSRNHNKQRELFFSSVCGLGDMPATHVNV